MSTPIFLRPEDVDVSWMNDAACRGSETKLFFPGRGASSHNQNAEAKAVCHSCPVKAVCLDVALRTCPDGIWGGTTWTERREIHKRKKRVA